jgi:hypothetical protein
VDEAAVERTLDRLIAWGLAEEHDGEVLATRRWNAKLQAAAEKLNILAAQMDANPEGNPLVLAVQQALANENLDGMTEETFPDAVRVLVVLELTRMGPEKRAQLGFGDATL